jgi:hypothetical protein
VYINTYLIGIVMVLHRLDIRQPKYVFLGAVAQSGDGLSCCCCGSNNLFREEVRLSAVPPGVPSCFTTFAYKYFRILQNI